jgi:hypothetical protein
MGRTCGTDGGQERRIEGVGGEIRGKETSWKTQAKWDDNIKMDLREVEWGGGGRWSGSIWLRTVTVGGLL